MPLAEPLPSHHVGDGGRMKFTYGDRSRQHRSMPGSGIRCLGHCLQSAHSDGQTKPCTRRYLYLPPRLPATSPSSVPYHQALHSRSRHLYLPPLLPATSPPLHAPSPPSAPVPAPRLSRAGSWRAGSARPRPHHHAQHLPPSGTPPCLQVDVSWVMAS